MDNSFLTDMNWLAVLVAAVAYFMLGAIWYSKALFGNTWLKSTGINMSNTDTKKGMGGVMAFTFLLVAITCIGLGILVHRLGLYAALSGVKLGLLTGICFAVTSISISYLYQSKPRVLWLIDGGYHLLGNVVAAVILCLWS